MYVRRLRLCTTSKRKAAHMVTSCVRARAPTKRRTEAIKWRVCCVCPRPGGRRGGSWPHAPGAPDTAATADCVVRWAPRAGIFFICSNELQLMRSGAFVNNRPRERRRGCAAVVAFNVEHTHTCVCVSSALVEPRHRTVRACTLARPASICGMITIGLPQNKTHTRAKQSAHAPNIT